MRLIPLRAILTTWPFLLSLSTLIANDLWLKRAYPGFITGKLSDVAGIALVTLLLLALAPQRRAAAVALIVAGFAFWKSPLSQALIDAANLYLPFAIARVVDLTDLLAFAVMPLCLPVACAPERFQFTSAAARKLLVPPIAAATLFGIMATSMVRTHQQIQVRQRNPAAELNRTVLAAAVAEVARKLDLECVDCADTARQASYGGKGLFLEYSFTDTRTVVFKTEAFPAGAFFGKSDRKRSEEMASALKTKLSATYQDLEITEVLPPR